ncbi:MAG: hypothetical protein K8T26_04890 [Lentisphaerae bacterium]|nr:hypothetical protein [Lentisphaerota bacterium]
MKLVYSAALSIALTLHAATATTGDIIIPRVDHAPALDGDLTDPCWSNALHLDTFTEPNSSRAPAQPTDALICLTDKALHLAFTCQVGDPARIVARQTRRDVWMDCSVELWIKCTDNHAEYDHFIVNSSSGRELIRHRVTNIDELPASPAWQVRSAITTNGWISEISIPFRDLGRPSAPAAGDLFELKLGREDYADVSNGGVASLSVWPAGTTYVPTEGYQRVYVERANLLRNADLLQVVPEGGVANWEVGGAVRTTQIEARDVIVMSAGEQPCRMEQTVKLPAGQLCRLAADVRGTVGGRLRGKSRSGESQVVAFEPSTNWTSHAISFIPKQAEPWFIVVETDGAGAGELALRDLTLRREYTADVMGRAIPVAVDTAAPEVITHIPVADCRAVRGAFGAPVDGTIDSRDYSGQRWEYNLNGEQANAGVRYLYRQNDGLHVTLADGAGVDAIQIHGGVHADVVADCRQYDDPDSGRLVHTFPGQANHSLARFDQRIAGDRFSFFNVHDGFIADLAFFRTGGDASRLGTAVSYTVAGPADTASLKPFFDDRFEADQRTGWTATPEPATNAPPLDLPHDTAVHILTAPLAAECALSAIGLRGTLTAAPGPIPLTIQVQDFLHPRTAITTVMLTLDGPGRLDLALDIPDQVLPRGARLWITLSAQKNASCEGPALVLYTVPRAQALPGALAYRLAKLKGFWGVLSEVRLWNAMPAGANLEAWLADIDNAYWRQGTAEIRDAIDHCTWLDRDDALVTQYRNWFYRSRNRPPLPAARLPAEPDAPEWAVVARTAWLEARRVATWWVDHRLVPSGEFGGSDDDGSLYQNFANVPMFEADGVARALKTGAAARAELDQAVRLDQGLGRTAQDPLHAYEEGLNQEALVTWWHDGDPLYLERCMQTTKSLQALTVVNAAGHRHFRGDIIGAGMLESHDRPLTFDSGFQAQLIHPACELALYNQNPQTVQFLRELGDAWLDHIAKSDPGQYPMGVEVASDRVVETSFEPFSSGFGCHASMMAFLVRITGESRYLQPLVDFLAGPEYPEFTFNYIPDLYQLGLFDDRPNALARQLANSPYLAWLATGDKRPFVSALREDIAELQTFSHFYTTVEPFTDRIFLYAAFNSARAYTGGYATRNKTYHSHAVSWEGFGTNFAALVRTGRSDRFSTLVYNFDATPAAGAVRFWMLEHGRYTLTLGADTDGDDKADSLLVSNHVDIVRGEAVPLVLPPRQTVVMTLTQDARLEPATRRADLALAARELSVTDHTVSGVVHNIGSADADTVEVALIDAQGTIHGQATLGALPAPLDLEPRRLPFSLQGLPSSHTGWRVVVDPADALPEITERNNTAVVP